MKKLSFILVLLFFTGCSTLGRETKREAIVPQVDGEAQAGVGDLFFMHDVDDRRPFAYPSRFNMKIKELNEKEIVLEYTEKKSFSFSTSDSVIRLKGYEFEILKVENGKITYRRIK